MPRITASSAAWFTAIVLTLVVFGCSKGAEEPTLQQEVSELSIQVTSSAFTERSKIPAKYTCEGADTSPAMKWTGVPDGTKSIVLVADDPDAPRGTWVHWVLYGLPPETMELPEGVPTTETLVSGARQGTNDFGRVGYSGPCPPRGHGPHRYYFKVYSLDTEIGLGPKATKADLVREMDGHILAQGQLMGTFERK